MGAGMSPENNSPKTPSPDGETEDVGAGDDGASSGDFLSGSLSPTHPERIGRYRILKLLGEGGMGQVYLAEREGGVRRKVALKTIRGGMNAREIVQRFEAERQVIASLNHANIAKFFEVGSLVLMRLVWDLRP